MPAESYKIVRMFKSDRKARVIKRGLTLEEAQAHCRDKETHSKTCTKRDRVEYTAMYGPWFDGYEQE